MEVQRTAIWWPVCAMMRRVKGLVLMAVSLAVLAGGLLAAVVGSAASTTAPALVPYSIAFWDKEHGLISSGWPSCQKAHCPGTSRSVVTGARRAVFCCTRTSRSSGCRSRRTVKCGSCGFQTCPAHPRLLRSMDSGATWRRVGLADFVQVSFGDANHGLGIRQVGVRTTAAHVQLLATVDGGRRWHPTTDPCALSRWAGDVQGVSLATPARGWVLCVNLYGVGNAGKSIYRTDDGGRHWQRLLNTQLVNSGGHQSSISSGGIGLYGYPKGIAFASDGLGVLWESRGTLYLTRDGGRHWKSFPRVSEPEGDFGSSAAAVPGRAFALLARLVARPVPVRLIATRSDLTGWRTVRTWTYLVN
jgi:photosystem II stability/assembly factor-like uncharacterized protein